LASPRNDEVWIIKDVEFVGASLRAARERHQGI
jgi:hypothetical protein